MSTTDTMTNAAGPGNSGRRSTGRRMRLVVPPESGPSPAARRFLWIFSVVMVLSAGTGFLFKLIEFFLTATSHGPDAMGSFLVPVANYLLVAAGFFCLFLWAYFTGQFRDLEGPKYRMLEMQNEIDRQEAEQEG